ncbi:ribosomal RNA processing protein 1 homolog A-like isoform X1 [Polypterus senegalus]|uniref:ribosomal RNA processing protein 1 homolog A-like isoform X1 n=2 Tax=Polypterus senegalus TaxID=55291 RepID=UPI0019645EE5|nr:ribosomal RNA processing protein 1 homolog A-like isoform X1 [Polypterus senegalus]
MASSKLPPEIQFAQKLASNETDVRKRAITKLRKYMKMRSQKSSGGFNYNELLKIWKGLFYCMWMQDKPLLQEEMSHVISRLMHSLQNIDAQYLFLETFLQTMNCEWNGIDRLRVDKFYMLVRHILRRTFEVLQNHKWEDSLMKRFLNMLNSKVLDVSSGAPQGIRFHILDIYMQELATVGADELTAEKNLQFIKPFCQIAATTEDQSLLYAIKENIFEDIIDKSPFAIEDLMKEVLENNQDCDNTSTTTNSQFDSHRLNGKKDNEEADNENVSAISEESDDIGPVLQFDYKAIADHLFDLARRGSTPPQNRKMIYKLVKKFEDLSEGNFPTDDYPEEVSTDEDDDCFGSRHRLKKRRKNETTLNEESCKKSKNPRKKEKNEDYSKDVERVEKKEQTELLSSANAETTNTKVASDLDFTNGITQTVKKKQKKKKKLNNPEVKKSSTSINPGLENGVIVLQESQDTNQNISKGSLGETRESMLGNRQSVAFSPVGICTLKKDASEDSIDVAGELASLKSNVLQEEEPGCRPSGVKILKKKKMKNRMKLLTPRQIKRPLKLLTKKVKRKAEVTDSSTTGHIGGDSKKIKKSKVNEEINISKISSRKAVLKKESKEKKNFVNFETPTIPVPVFFKTPSGKCCTPISSIKKQKTPDSISKKVTFGLNRNKTAEFKKNDKSILVSPEGTSKVAFDPNQKPLYGVLKTPASPSIRLKKNMSSPRKKRATAADFF